MTVGVAYPGRMSRRRRVVVALLVAAGVAAAVLVLNPWQLHDLAASSIARSLHHIGFPSLPGFPATEFVGNIAMFMPLGLLGALLVPRGRWWAVLGALVASSVGIETVQALALPYRTASTHDVLANSLGAAIGVALALLVPRTRPARA